MLREAMEWFKNTIEKPNVLLVDEQPEELLYIDHHTLQHQIIPALRKARVWEALSIDDLVNLTKRFGASEGDHSLYVSDQQVQSVLQEDRSSRRNRVTLKLDRHPAFQSLTTGTCASSKDLSEFIRVDLFDCEVTPLDLRERLQMVKFQKQEVTDTTARQCWCGDIHQHGDEQLGSSITKKMTGTGDIPSSCIVKFEPYPALSEELNGMEVSVQCCISIDLSDGLLSMRPFPGQVEQAAHEGMMAVARLTREKALNVPVFLGFTQ